MGRVISGAIQAPKIGPASAAVGTPTRMANRIVRPMSAWYRPIDALFRFLPYVRSSFSCREIQPFNASSEG